MNNDEIYYIYKKTHVAVFETVLAEVKAELTSENATAE